MQSGSRSSGFFTVLAISFLAPVLSPFSATAVSILEIERSVRVSTLVDAADVFTDEDSVVRESDAPGDFFEAAVGGVGFGDIVNASGEAVQDSAVEIVGGGLLVDASGSVGVVFDVNDPGFASTARGTATTIFSLTFEVETARAYSLAASLLADLDQLSVLSAPGAAHADPISQIELSDGDGRILIEARVDDGRADGQATSQDLVREGVLAPGLYRLYVKSRVFLEGSENAAGFATSGFGVSLLIAPEPSSLLLAGIGLLGLAAYARRTARLRA